MGTDVKTGTAYGINGRRGAAVEVAAVGVINIAVGVTTLGKADLAVKRLPRKGMGRSVAVVTLKATAAGMVALSLAIREWE